jgi:hypothetical protein
MYGMVHKQHDRHEKNTTVWMEGGPRPNATATVYMTCDVCHMSAKGTKVFESFLRPDIVAWQINGLFRGSGFSLLCSSALLVGVSTVSVYTAIRAS